ncbi:uncharacterized protein LOC119707932 [Motacilla alba alba]|uniref:uncharacterized protein LOC119707932 n=1 Tax=Motacilla alba alba TaxID=1094192 RepID=UPI0018D5492F|nr:uncharacterized protein LOC119707932 [Motacilla alba alba]
MRQLPTSRAGVRRLRRGAGSARARLPQWPRAEAGDGDKGAPQGWWWRPGSRLARCRGHAGDHGRRSGRSRRAQSHAKDGDGLGLATAPGDRCPQATAAPGRGPPASQARHCGRVSLAVPRLGLAAPGAAFGNGNKRPTVQPPSVSQYRVEVIGAGCSPPVSPSTDWRLLVQGAAPQCLPVQSGGYWCRVQPPSVSQYRLEVTGAGCSPPSVSQYELEVTGAGCSPPSVSQYNLEVTGAGCSPPVSPSTDWRLLVQGAAPQCLPVQGGGYWCRVQPPSVSQYNLEVTGAGCSPPSVSQYNLEVTGAGCSPPQCLPVQIGGYWCRVQPPSVSQYRLEVTGAGCSPPVSPSTIWRLLVQGAAPQCLPVQSGGYWCRVQPPSVSQYGVEVTGAGCSPPSVSQYNLEVTGAGCGPPVSPSTDWRLLVQGAAPQCLPVQGGGYWCRVQPPSVSQCGVEVVGAGGCGSCPSRRPRAAD